MPDCEIGYVHAAAATFTVPVLLAEEFGYCAVRVVLEDFFQKRLTRLRRGLRQPCPQLILAHPANGHGAFCKAVAVSAMRAGDVVLQQERTARTNRCRFLPDGHMRCAAVLEIPKRFIRAGTCLNDHLFQLADGKHIFQQSDRFCGIEPTLLEFLLQVPVVSVCGNGAALNLKRGEIRP